MRIKYKYIIPFISLGVIFWALGSFLKILRWAFDLGMLQVNANGLILTSTACWIIAGVLFILKAILAKGNDILNQ